MTHFEMVNKVVSLEDTGYQCENSITIPNRGIDKICSPHDTQNTSKTFDALGFELIFQKDWHNAGDRFWIQIKGMLWN